MFHQMSYLLERFLVVSFLRCHMLLRSHSVLSEEMKTQMQQSNAKNEAKDLPMMKIVSGAFAAQVNITQRVCLQQMHITHP